MKGIILAAGVASRLRPLTDNIPKCLLPVGKKSILERSIDNLIHNGINEFIIVTGYLEEMIKSFINENYPDLKVHLISNERYDSTNNIYSLWLARDLFTESDIILMDSDIIFDQRIIELLMDSASKNRLAVRFEDNMGEEEMKVLISENNHILSISKEIEPARAAGESMGIAKFDRKFVSKLMNIVERRIFEEGRENEFYEAAFQEAIEEGENLFAVDIGDYRCVEIDTAEDLAYVRDEVIRELDA
jgi:choline kinase